MYISAVYAVRGVLGGHLDVPKGHPWGVYSCLRFLRAEDYFRSFFLTFAILVVYLVQWTVTKENKYAHTIYRREVQRNLFAGIFFNVYR